MKEHDRTCRDKTEKLHKQDWDSIIITKLH